MMDCNKLVVPLPKEVGPVFAHPGRPVFAQSGENVSFNSLAMICETLLTRSLPCGGGMSGRAGRYCFLAAIKTPLKRRKTTFNAF